MGFLGIYIHTLQELQRTVDLPKELGSGDDCAIYFLLQMPSYRPRKKLSLCLFKPLKIKVLLVKGEYGTFFILILV